MKKKHLLRVNREDNSDEPISIKGKQMLLIINDTENGPKKFVLSGRLTLKIAVVLESNGKCSL